MPAGLMSTTAVAAGIGADGSLQAERPALTMGVYARGTDPRNRTIWHESFSGVKVIEVPALTRDLVPDYVLTPADMVAVKRVLDPDTLRPLPGLSVIKVVGVEEPIGFAGGNKRLNWTGAQPDRIFEVAERVAGAGGSIESAFWLDDGRFVVEGTLPLDATHRATFGEDVHFLRFTFVGNFSGSGTDMAFVTLVRAVCANMTRVAMFDAAKHGDIIKVRHAKDVDTRWDVNVTAFVAGYSGLLAEHVTKLAELNTRKLTDSDAYFRAVIGTEPEKGKAATFYAWKLAALRNAYKAERANAEKVGIDPNSQRVAYETVTNVLNHGGVIDKGDGNGETWWNGLNGARTDTGRAWNVLTGDGATNALALALA